MTQDDPATPPPEPSTPVEQLPPDDITPIWEQQHNEPNLWFDRFHAYLMQGAQRTFLHVYLGEWRRAKARKGASLEQIKALKTPRTLPTNWALQIAAWSWRERAAAWDAWQRDVEVLEYMRERAQERRNRINLMRGLRGWAASVIPNLPKGGKGQPLPDPMAVIRAAQVSVQELRKEFMDEPEQRQDDDGRIGQEAVQSSEFAELTDEELEDQIGRFAALLPNFDGREDARAGPPSAPAPAGSDPGSPEPSLDDA